ncbi:MAG TPA: hypothetical protein VNR17_10225 [Luteimicrobium sp.]|nr:hypothetical protein [Luteimicrobium sp.]
MTSFAVYATPPAVAELPVSPWTSLRHTWQGPDGSTWNLSDPAGGVFLLSSGVVGLHMPQFDQYVDEYANLDGGVYRGSRAQVRNPEWTLLIWDDGSTAGFKERYRALWSTLDPDRPGLWTVTDAATGEARTLVVRFRTSEEMSYDRDPLKAGWAIYSVTLLAEDPFWRGAPVLSPAWGADDSVNFTGPSDVAPDYYVSASASLSSAELTNDGDVDAWLTYTITGGTGGLTSVDIATAGGDIGFGAVAEGAVLRISTDPATPVMTLNGVDVGGDVDPWDPRPIPAAGTSPLTITLVGHAIVQASFTPRYYRAF